MHFPPTFAHMPHLSQTDAILAARYGSGAGVRSNAGASVGWQGGGRSGYSHTEASVGAIVVTASDITQALTQFDGVAQNIDVAVQSCPAGKMDNTTRTEWDNYYANYRAFSAANKNLGFWTLGLPNIGDQVISYEHGLNDWNDKINRMCGGSLPTTLPGDVVAQNDSPFPTLGGTSQNPGGGLNATLTRVAWIAGIVLLGVVAIEVAPALLPHHRRYAT